MHQAIINLHQNAYDGMASSEGLRFDSSWGSEFFLVPHSQRKHLSLRPVLFDWYERGKPSVFCQNFQHEWSGLFTVKLRKL